MKTIDFTLPGGFPLTQDILNIMQESYKEDLGHVLKHIGVPQTGKFILSGLDVNVDTQTVTDGVIVVDGNIYLVIGGSGSYIDIINTNTSLTYQDSIDKVAVYTAHAQVVNSNGDYSVSEFTRFNSHRDYGVNGSLITLIDTIYYKIELLNHTTSIKLVNSTPATDKFIVNHIQPFPLIKDGHELIIQFQDLTGLTGQNLATQNSNIRLKHLQSGAIPAVDSEGNFFQNNSGPEEGATSNLMVILKWSANLNKWIEVMRAGYN